MRRLIGLQWTQMRMSAHHWGMRETEDLWPPIALDPPWCFGNSFGGMHGDPIEVLSSPAVHVHPYASPVEALSVAMLVSALAFPIGRARQRFYHAALPSRDTEFAAGSEVRCQGTLGYAHGQGGIEEEKRNVRGWHRPMASGDDVSDIRECRERHASPGCVAHCGVRDGVARRPSIPSPPIQTE